MGVNACFVFLVNVNWILELGILIIRICFLQIENHGTVDRKGS